MVDWEEISVWVAGSVLGATAPVLLDCGSERLGVGVGGFNFRILSRQGQDRLQKVLPGILGYAKNRLTVEKIQTRWGSQPKSFFRDFPRRYSMR